MASSPLTSDLPTPPLPLITAITWWISFRCSAAPFLGDTDADAALLLVGHLGQLDLNPR